MSMTDEEFDACFDEARHSVFRLETLQRYTVVEEAERIEAFRRGAPRPDRSVRTSPWLRRIAVSTAAGLRWSRARLVELPVSEYVRYQLQGYVESAAAGEEIRLAVLNQKPDLQQAIEIGDFWLFDGGTPQARAVALHYDHLGRPIGEELIAEAGVLDRLTELHISVWNEAQPLNEFLAHTYRQPARSA